MLGIEMAPESISQGRTRSDFAGSTTDGRKILLVDDDRPSLDGMASVLEHAGYTMICASSCREAEQVLGQQSPDLVIAELQLEGSLGLKLLAHVRSRPVTASIPIILSTRTIDPVGLRRAMNLGADGFAFKPIVPEQFTAMVRARLRRSESMRNARSHLLSVLDQVPVFAGICDPWTRRLIYLNSTGCRLSGVTDVSEISGDDPGIIFQPDQGPALFPAAWEHAKSTPTGWKGDALLVGRRSEPIPVSLEVQAHRTDDGDLEFYSLMARDNTLYRDLERARAQDEKLFSLMVAQITEYAIIMLDAHGHVATWNAGAARTTGYSADEILGRHINCFHPPEDLKVGQADRILQQARDTGHVVDEGWRVRKDGSRCWVKVVLTAIRDEHGSICGFAKITQDLTERREAEQERERAAAQLHHAQKLESIGRLAAGIAHEINTPIQFVGDNIQFLQRTLPDLFEMIDGWRQLGRRHESSPELAAEMKQLEARAEQADIGFLATEVPECISQAMEGIDRVTRIVGAMKDFSHSGGTGCTAVDLNRMIESTTVVARNEWKFVAELHLDLDPALGTVHCNAGEFNQVMLNLLINAAHAITARIGTRPATRGRISVATRRWPGTVEVRVADTGTGVPPEIQGRLFEPFFTTKPVGQGTGQGLALAHAIIVEKHGGQLSFETEPGKGTCFIIRLPDPAKAGEGSGS